ncbi:unnamed protein product, partial [Phaeothamnion confervicola]
AEEDNGPSALQLFVSGDRSQVGKSSICLGLLGALVRHGFPPSSLAYIKPATQCEAEQPVAVWCRRAGIACVGVGPIVFYPGFTREFLKGSVGTSADLLAEAVAAVHRVSRGRRLVVVDGVGYPAVGSICGVSNADVAAALGAAVLLVGRPGVGDAVDSFNLNTCFFESRSITVLGGVFNRLKLDGFYSLASCREAVTAYFAQRRPQQMPYGFVPDIGAGNASAAAMEASGNAGEAAAAAADAGVSSSEPAAPSVDTDGLALAEALIDAVATHVDVARLVRDLEQLSASAAVPTSSLSPPPPPPSEESGQGAASGTSALPRRRNRKEIEADAAAQGATIGTCGVRRGGA